jgi:tetratricopeptide (TPR) repeat protein
VLCVALNAPAIDRKEAASSEVTLISLDRPKDDEFKPDWSTEVSAAIEAAAPSLSVDWWVGHDVKTGPIAVEMARHNANGNSAVIMHMSYDSYLFVKHDAEAAAVGVERQRGLLKEATVAFAVGPLLFERLQDIRRGDPTSEQLIPGLPDFTVAPPKGRLCAVTFGRFERDQDLMKQAPLAVAGFASAVKSGRQIRLLAFEDASLHVIGAPADTELTLRTIAEHYAQRVLNIGIHGFIENRRELQSRLEQCNLSMMLSWHEGFGLTGWEAIGVGLPTILSRESGLYRLLAQIGGQATGCVQVIDVRGSHSKGSVNRQDLGELRDLILRIGTELPKYLKDAECLARLLRSQLCFSWAATATTMAKRLALPLKRETVGPTGLDRQILEEPAHLTLSLGDVAVSGALRLAAAFVERGEYDEALSTIGDLEQSGSAAQSSPDVVIAKAEVLLRLNRYNESQLLLEGIDKSALVKDGCRNFRAGSVLNTIFRDTGQYEKAVSIGRDLVTIATSDCTQQLGPAKRKLSRSLALSGAWQEALSEANGSWLLSQGSPGSEKAKALLAIAEAYRHGLDQIQAIQVYSDSRERAAKSGHVDCYMWAALGLADSLFLVGEYGEASAILERLAGFIDEGRQRFPLERLHTELSRLVIGLREDREILPELDEVVTSYQRLGIEWVASYVDTVKAGDFTRPKRF